MTSSTKPSEPRNALSKRPATIRDVAKMAGVSTATVSKFINGLQRFTPAVEERLRETIAALGYRQNPLARSMVTGETRTFGLAVMDVRNPHFANIVKGANRIALEHDYNLLVVDLQERQSHERHLLEALSMRVDGLIVSSRIPDDSIDWITEIGKPVVFFGRLQRPHIMCVRTDGYQAARFLAAHVMASGRKRIAYLGFPVARWNQERLLGVKTALAEANLPVDHYAVEFPTLEGGQAVAAEVLNSPNRPDAVICFNDLVAIGFMHEAQAMGWKVPEDIAVAGFDDVPVARFMTPALTTVNMRSEEQGEAAMRCLLDAVSKGNPGSDYLFEPQLICRASTARL
jgi:DNA-binding LacI/PurR family transcriptional regulator